MLLSIIRRLFFPRSWNRAPYQQRSEDFWRHQKEEKEQQQRLQRDRKDQVGSWERERGAIGDERKWCVFCKEWIAADEFDYFHEHDPKSWPKR